MNNSTSIALAAFVATSSVFLTGCPTALTCRTCSFKKVTYTVPADMQVGEGETVEATLVADIEYDRTSGSCNNAGNPPGCDATEREPIDDPVLPGETDKITMPVETGDDDDVTVTIEYVVHGVDGDRMSTFDADYDT